MVRANPRIPAEDLSEGLRLALPGFDDLVTSDACGELDDGIADVSFGLANSAIGFGDDVREAVKALREVDVFWGDGRDRKLTTLPCELSDS